MNCARIERQGTNQICVLEDPETGSSARILISYGFNCYSFRCRVGGAEHELLSAADGFDRDPSRPSANGIPVLFPFPNRIAGGRFEFAGARYQLPRNERGVNAIHGMVIDRPWRVVSLGSEGRAEVTGVFQLSQDAPELAPLWPADFRIEMTYSLSANQLTNRVRVVNPDQRPLPWGFGTHPYFRLPIRPGGDASRCTVQAAVSQWWELEELIPTGRRMPVDGAHDLRHPQPLAPLKLDHVFTGLEFANGWSRHLLTDHVERLALEFRFDELFGHLVIYIPPARGAICLEPYTCVTDAINLERRGVDSGLRVLQPGESTDGTIVMAARGLDYE